MNSNNMEDMLSSARRSLPSPPSSTTVVPCALGVCAFGSTLALSTLAQLRLSNISTGTRFPIPTLVGAASVVLASLAGHEATKASHDRLRCKGRPSFPFYYTATTTTTTTTTTHRGFDGHTALRVGLLGLCSFRLLGGRCWGVAPSSYAHLGSFARPRSSLPATHKYATEAQRRAVQALGRRHGCHTCGVRYRVLFHADHMPPNYVVKRDHQRLWRRLFPKLRITQRFYPQCVDCSATQGKILSRVATSGGRAAVGEARRPHGWTRARRYHLTGGVVAGVTLWGSEDNDGGDYTAGYSMLEQRLRRFSLEVGMLIEDIMF